MADVGEYNHFMESRILAPPVVLIVAGAIVFIVAFLGCFGAVREKPNILIAVSTKYKQMNNNETMCSVMCTIYLLLFLELVQFCIFSSCIFKPKCADTWTPPDQIFGVFFLFQFVCFILKICILLYGVIAFSYDNVLSTILKLSSEKVCLMLFYTYKSS